MCINTQLKSALTYSNGLVLQEWETEVVAIDMGGLGSQEDLRLDLAGGRDDLHCPADKPIYVSSIAKGSFLEGKLK